MARTAATVASPPCRNTPDTTRFTFPTPRATCGVRSASLRVFQSKYTLQYRRNTTTKTQATPASGSGLPP